MRLRFVLPWFCFLGFLPATEIVSSIGFTRTNLVSNGAYLGDRFLFATEDGTISGWQGLTTSHLLPRIPFFTQAADPGKTPAGLSASDWNGIRQEYERNRHAAFAIPGGYQARNFGQQWLVQFDGRGFEVKPDGAQWTWGLQLEGYGRPGQLHTISGHPAVSAAKERVSYDWSPGIREWWINDGRGVEHGFTVRKRPSAEGDSLVIRLGVRGGLQPRVQEDSRGVSFVDGSGRSVVNYTGLKVWDADGHVLNARMRTLGAGVQVEVDDRSARYPLTIDPVAQQAYLKASNSGADDRFGVSVAVSGDTVVVGADNEDSNATGVNGNQSDNSASEAGAAYVFVRNAGVWTQQAYLKASNSGANDRFGVSVAVSGDTVVVGADFEFSNATGVNGNQSDNSAIEAGAAYVFVRNAGVWTQQAYLKASNTEAGDFFGVSVAVSGDTVVVGAFIEDSNATGVNGNQSDNSASGSGAAYVFVRNVGVWTQQAYLKASNTGAGDSFGGSVAVSGDTVVVGASGEDSNATGVNGNQSDNSAFDSGAAYVFVRNAGVWTQQAYLKASNTGANDFFGSVAVSGDTVVVGASGEDSNAAGVNGNQSDNSAEGSGAAYVFVRNAGVWTQQAYLKASNTGAFDRFGVSVAVSGDTVVVGASGEDSNAAGVNGNQSDNSAEGSGAAYVFVRNAGVWTQQAYLKASNSGARGADDFIGDSFGVSVAVSGDTVVVGASGEDSNATGVNGNQSDNSASESGAAYVFSTTLDTTPPQIVPTVTGTLGANAWYTSSVTVSWSVTDPESGISSSVGCEAANLTSNTAGTTLTCSATNGAGLSYSASVTIRIDKSPPQIVPTVTGTLGANAWYTSNVTVSWSVTDPESGISSSVGCEAANLTSNTAGTTLTCSATNGSGLSNSASVTIRIDTTPPQIVPTVTGTLGATGWYTSNVTVSLSVTDPESGISSSAGCTSATLTANTAGITLTCAATNGAGLTNSATVTIKIDKTPPAVTGLPPAKCSLWPPYHQLIQVATISASAGISGLASFSVTGQSNEPVNGLGDGDTAPDIVINGNGNAPKTVLLRAERSGTGTGRIYTLRATSTNGAGSTTTVTGACTVPLAPSAAP